MSREELKKGLVDKMVNHGHTRSEAYEIVDLAFYVQDKLSTAIREIGERASDLMVMQQAVYLSAQLAEQYAAQVQGTAKTINDAINKSSSLDDFASNLREAGNPKAFERFLEHLSKGEAE